MCIYSSDVPRCALACDVRPFRHTAELTVDLFLLFSEFFSLIDSGCGQSSRSYFALWGKKDAGATPSLLVSGSDAPDCGMLLMIRTSYELEKTVRMPPYPGHTLSNWSNLFIFGQLLQGAVFREFSGFVNE